MVVKFGPQHFLVALEEARRVIKVMPPARVPHSLRRIRGSSSRRLTPVEARALYRELETNEDLRQETLDSWDAPRRGDADPRAEASALFLGRPEGWESQARRHIQQVALHDARAEIKILRKDLSEHKSREKRLRTRLSSVREETERVFEEGTRALQQDVARHRARIAELEKQLAEEQRATLFWEKEANLAFDELTQVDRRYEDLRERYGAKAKATPAVEADRGGMSFSRDPLEAARMLDQMVSYWEVGFDPGPGPAPTRRRLEMPAGIDPKGQGAIRWVFFEAPRLILIVDGWNVAYNWHYHRNILDDPTRQTVEYITNKLNQLARYSVGRHQVSLYLDSRHVNGWVPRWDNRFKSGRLTGYYVDNADDAIAEEAAEREGAPVVVITSDNDLAERCRAHGALRLFSEALAEWMTDPLV